MEKRKHVSQMTPQEITFLKSKFRHVKEPIYTNYSLGRLSQRKIQRKQVVRALKIGELVEYHLVGRHHRVLVRGTASKRGEVVCVVLDIFTREVVTVFKNVITDRHWTLNPSNYDNKVDILNIMKWSGKIV